MALVQLTDVVIPAVYNTYTAVDSPETTLFFQSGVAVTNDALLSAFDGGGNIAILPFWNDLDASSEPNYGTDSPSDVATPDKITTGEQITRVVDVNKWYSAANLTGELAGSDPMAAIRNRFGVWWKRQWQHRLLAMCVGLYNANVAQNSGDMVESVAVEDVDDVTDANLFAGTAFINALLTLGDQMGAVIAVAVHSVIYGQMLKANLIEFFKPSENAAVIPTYMQKLVIVDDSMPVRAGTTSGFVYTSILFGAGAIGYAEGLPTIAAPSELYNQPLEGNGQGVMSIGERKRWVLHPAGYKFTSNTVTGQSPTLANLKVAANWTRVVPRKNVPVAFLNTNG